VQVLGGAELTEHTIQQALKLLSMQVAEAIDQPAGEELLLGFNLQLQSMQPMAGSCWGAIPLARGVIQLEGAEWSVGTGITELHQMDHIRRAEPKGITSKGLNPWTAST
jgi:hypothetical protein